MSTLLSFASAIKFFGFILLAIAILLVLVTIHEFGHYLAGKMLKFKINEFSIGFGPKIFQKTKKNGELFTIRGLPLGGYCAFEGEDGTSEDENAFAKQPAWKRLIVLFAGPLFNFLSAFVFTFIYLLAIPKYSFGNALLNCVPQTFEFARLIFEFIGQLFTGQIGVKGNLVGPVNAIGQIASLSEENIRVVLVFFPFLSVNLGIFNLIPFPALDGGQMFFTLIEMIIRKPIKQEIINKINIIGLIVLLGLVIFLDIYAFV